MTLETIVKKIHLKKPKIHSITNTITINDCANIVLAAGGSATMASDPREAAEMTEHTDALVLNLGAVSSLEAMLSAGKRANQATHPVVFDPVAAGATELRREASRQLLKQLSLTAIRGNAAEIHTLAVLSRELENTSPQKNSDLILSFVDVDDSNSMQKKNLEHCLEDASALSQNTGAIVVVSGIEDLVVFGDRYELFEGGSPLSSHITGSGCMLTELIGVCLAVTDEPPIISSWDAVCAAVQWMNRAAEEAEHLTSQAGGGTMTYRMHLIDTISKPLLLFHSES